MGGARRWVAARAGIRVRSAVAAAAVVAVALAVGAVVLVVLLDRALGMSVRDLAAGQAEQVAAGLAADATGQLARDSQRLSGSGLGLVHVVTPAGQVLAASPQLAGRPPLLPDRPAPGQRAISTVVVAELGEEPSLVVVARGVHTPADGDLVVQVGRPSGSAERATEVAIGLMLAGVPLLAAVAAVATYWFVGRSLRPVEDIRSRVAVLTGRDLVARLPVPAAQDEVRRLAETMNEMLARLRAAQLAQRRFVADASHELRSPIATISATLENAQAGELDTDTVAALRAETDRLARLVTDLLVLARADEHGGAARRDEVDLDELVDAERIRVRETASEVAVRAQTSPVRVLGDRDQLAMVIRNLVDNAVRHAASAVLLRLGREDGRENGRAVLEVIDDGPGVPAVDRQRIFGRFVRLDDSRVRTKGGAGLGLAIVAEVVRAHGGEVTVADAPGGGARFTVRLPAHQVAAAPPVSSSDSR